MAVGVLSGKLSKAQVASLYGVTVKIVSRWSERFRTGGRTAIMDRSSHPRHSPRQIKDGLVEKIISLPRQRLTGKPIARVTGASPATVSRVLRRAKVSRMKDIDRICCKLFVNAWSDRLLASKDLSIFDV